MIAALGRFKAPSRRSRRSSRRSRPAEPRRARRVDAPRRDRQAATRSDTPIAGLALRSTSRRLGRGPQARDRRRSARSRTARRSPRCSPPADDRGHAVRGDRRPWPRCPTSVALQVYLRGLADQEPRAAQGLGRPRSAAIRDQAAPVLDQLAGRHELSPSPLPELRRILRRARARSPPGSVLGPFPIDASPADLARPARRPRRQLRRTRRQAGHLEVGQAGRREGGRSTWASSTSGDGDRSAFGYAEVQSPTDRTAQMAVGSDDTLTVWLNGKQVYDFKDRRGFEPRAGHGSTSRCVKGTNRVLIKCGNRGGPWQFAVAVTVAGRLRLPEGPGGRRLRPRRLPRRRDEGQGQARARPGPLRRPEGPGLHQVPRRRRARGATSAPSCRASARSIRATS